MAKSFDFTSVKTPTMSVTLFDEKKIILSVLTPTKKLKDELNDLFSEIETIEDEDIAIDTLYEFTARVMSRNKQGIEISADKLKALYPDEDYVIAFLKAYVEFINEVKLSKN